MFNVHRYKGGLRAAVVLSILRNAYVSHAHIYLVVGVISIKPAAP